MPWVRIDDHFDEHPKLAGVGPLGWALWFAGLAYCNRNLTDGFIPWSTAAKLVSWDYLDGSGQRRVYVGDPAGAEGLVTSEYVVGLLIRAGLWDTVEGGYRIHDYAQYQPTKAVIEAERAKKVAAGAAGGHASATARGSASGSASGSARGSGPRSREASAEAPAEAKSNPVPVPVPVPGATVLDTEYEDVGSLDGARVNGRAPVSEFAPRPKEPVERKLTLEEEKAELTAALARRLPTSG